MARSSGQTVKLKPADPFDLIRWLARSQSDPRKAVAELVQNSIDANARLVRIERRRHRRQPALVIHDDGEGVVPNLEREEALRAIASSIGHSRKRGLTPRERHDQVVAGKYGIGLLGFWSVGHRMEIRSRVQASPLAVLRLVEDQERAELGRIAIPIGAPETFTEIIITELHETASRALAGRRLCEYLAAELRGPILATGAKIEIDDHLARGSMQRRFSVVPRRYAGQRLDLPELVDVPGYAPIRVEIYLVRGAETAAIHVGCAGTLVADDIGHLASLGLDEPPWSGAGLGGMVDFPGFNVPPSTRRGVIPDAAAEAFVRALESVRPAVLRELQRFDRERGELASRQVMQDLRRALRGLRDRLPQYELPRVSVGDEAPVIGVPGGPLERSPDPAANGAPATETIDDEREAKELPLFPPGPLATVSIVPALCELSPGEERRVVAVMRDANQRRLAGVVVLDWSLDGDGTISIESGGTRPAVRAAPDARMGTSAILRVVAVDGEHRAEATSSIVVSEMDRRDAGGFGIPEPELVDDPNGLWRSRFDGERWQVNALHPDYTGTHGDGRFRFRYLLACLTKEIVQRTHGSLGTEPVLESFVEILSHCERNLREANGATMRPGDSRQSAKIMR